VGYGYPPDQCPTCSSFWSEADTDERPTGLCRMFCTECGFERYYFLADFTPSLPRGVPNLCPNCGKEWQRQICHYRNLVWMLCLSCGHQQYYIRHGRGRVEPVQCLQYALRGEHSWKRFKSDEGGYEQRSASQIASKIWSWVFPDGSFRRESASIKPVADSGAIDKACS